MLVTVMVLTVVLLTLTRLTYPRLTAYDGTYTSRGPNGNQPILPPNPPPPPTNTTKAGAYTGATSIGPGTQPQRPSTDIQRP